MEAIKFTLSGKNAFFKKPEVNSYYYFTYGHIHKVALLGMFGAILGLQGYSQKKWKEKNKQNIEEYPEFYEKLKDLKISIVPGNEKGYIPKKVQVFNNSVGYASKEAGGNQIIKEQWLESPVWHVYLLIDCEMAEMLADFLQRKRCIYMPYLGKNDHTADITDVEKIFLNKKEYGEYRLSGLYLKCAGQICLPDEDEEEDDEIQIFKYEEKLPIALNGFTNLYEYETFCYTNMNVKVSDGVLYQDGKKILMFY